MYYSKRVVDEIIIIVLEFVMSNRSHYGVASYVLDIQFVISKGNPTYQQKEKRKN